MANPRRWAVEVGWQSCTGEWKRAWMSSVRTLNAASVFESRVETKIKSHRRPVGPQNHLTTQSFLLKEAGRRFSLHFQKTFLKITSVWIKHSCAKWVEATAAENVKCRSKSRVVPLWKPSCCSRPHSERNECLQLGINPRGSSHCTTAD